MTLLGRPLGGVDAGKTHTLLADLPFHPDDWDRALSIPDHCALAVRRLAAAGPDQAWAALDGSRVLGVACLSALPWDTGFFGLPMGRLDLLRAADPGAVDVLLEAVRAAAEQAGLRHLHHVLDARDQGLVRAFEGQGWHHAWTSVRMVADTARREAEAVPSRVRSVEVVESTTAHLPELTEVAARLPRYSWLQHEPGLPADRRAAYRATRLRSCVEGDLADVCLTLLHRGRPVGFNASALARHGDGTLGSTFTFERDTFVDPAAPRGASRLLAQHVVARLTPRARYLTGLVRLPAVAMFRLLESVGFASSGGVLHLTLDLPG